MRSSRRSRASGRSCSRPATLAPASRPVRFAAFAALVVLYFGGVSSLQFQDVFAGKRMRRREEQRDATVDGVAVFVWILSERRDQNDFANAETGRGARGDQPNQRSSRKDPGKQQHFNIIRAEDLHGN